jgi:hypothetical protein
MDVDDGLTELLVAAVEQGTRKGGDVLGTLAKGGK